jgi:hypothetical protein
MLINKAKSKATGKSRGSIEKVKSLLEINKPKSKNIRKLNSD